MALPQDAHSNNVNLVFAELLQKIIEDSKPSELLGLRLVNRQWKEVATTMLLKRNSLHIQFELDVKSLECRSKGGITFYSIKRNEKIRQLCLPHRSLDKKIIKQMQFDKTLPDFYRLIKSHLAHQNSSSSSLTLCLTPYSSLPVNSFGFHVINFTRRNRLMEYSIHPHLLTFVKKYGAKLRSLTLDSYVHYFVGNPENFDFILQYTPNIESLIILDKDYTNISDSEDDPMKDPNDEEKPQFTLPHLKFLEMGKLTWAILEILPHLLKIAPQLERVYFPVVENLKIIKIFPASKIKLINIGSLCLNSQDLFFEGLENLEYLVNIMTTLNRPGQPGVNLKCLQIYVGAWPPTRESWKRGIAALRQMFHLNQRSLEEIVLLGGATLIIQKIPGLTALLKVTKLSVKISFDFRYPDGNFDFSADDDDNKNFQFQGTLLSELFPNREKLELSVPNLLEEDRGDVKRFPFWYQKLRGVKTYKVQFNSFSATPNMDNAVAVFDEVLSLCPEMTSLSTTLRQYEMQFPFKMQSLWNLSQLTSLHLEFERSIADFDNFLDLDAAFTGLSKDAVRAIHSNWRMCRRWEEPKNLGQGQFQKVKSSLSDLKSLRTLQLDFFFYPAGEPRILISGVSAKFAFDLIENLKVSILFKMYTQACPKCVEKDYENRGTWLEFHKPLQYFPNVNVTIKEE